LLVYALLPDKPLSPHLPGILEFILHNSVPKANGSVKNPQILVQRLGLPPGLPQQSGNLIPKLMPLS